MSHKTTIVWFQQDLRLADNPALRAAVDRDGPVLPVYVWSPESDGGWPPGAASQWYLRESLAALDADLRKRGSRLILRSGKPEQALLDLANEAGATAVYWNRRYEPAARETARRVGRAFERKRLEAASFKANLLLEPEEIATKSGGPYKVYTPFAKECRKRFEQAAVLPGPCETAAPSDLAAPRRRPTSEPFDDMPWPDKQRWLDDIKAQWTPGEARAQRRLEAFVEDDVAAYGQGRDLMALDATSRLSPSLHFGEISPRQVWLAVEEWVKGKRDKSKRQSAEVFLSQILWREFAHHLLWHFPRTPTEPLREEFVSLPWRNDAEGLEAWRRGRTGCPIVDAAMRQLWRTGWMHNRARMIVASYLTKDLLIPWLEGARWFCDRLVDADLANNTLGWQWTAGCGADAAPFFRVFNPERQAKRFDPEGEYVRRWVPELRDEDEEGSREDYPGPVVDHKMARQRALAAYEKVKKAKRSIAGD